MHTRVSGVWKCGTRPGVWVMVSAGLRSQLVQAMGTDKHLLR